MGCGAAKTVKMEKLAEVEYKISLKPWTFMGRVTDLRQLESVVGDLAEVHEYFKNGREDIVQRIGKAALQLKDEVQGAMDPDLLSKGDILMVKKLETIARRIDQEVMHVGATEALREKKQGLQKKFGQEQVRAANGLLKKWEESHSLPEQKEVEFAQRVHGKLQGAHMYVLDVLELERDFFLCAGELSSRVETIIDGVLECYPAGVFHLERLAASLDSMCQRLPGGASWKSLEQVLQGVKSRAGQKQLPQRFVEVETELQKASASMVDFANVMKLLEGIVALWSETVDQPLQERLNGCFNTVEERMQQKFDLASNAADETKMEAVIEHAEKYDKLREQINGVSHATSQNSFHGIVHNFKTRKAQVGLSALLKRAQSVIDHGTPTLQGYFREAESKAKKMSKEKLKSSAEPPSWGFKLRGGDFKAYSAEKSLEVEKYYQEWLQAGKPADKKYEVHVQIEERRIRKMGTGSVARKRERCTFGDKCYRKNKEHLAQFSHPRDEDWDEEATPPPTASPPPTGSTRSMARTPSNDFCGECPPTSSLKMETYILDFSLMTQAAKSRKGAHRNINRKAGITYGQKITSEYFQEFDMFINTLKTCFEKIEFDLGMLEEEERQKKSKELDSIIETLKAPMVDFFNLAAFMGETERRDDTVARLGMHADKIGVETLLIDAKLTEALQELRSAYAVLKPRTDKRRWVLLRMLRKEKLITARMALVQKKRDLMTHKRRRAQMAILTVISDAGDNTLFKEKASQGVLEVLEEAVKNNADVDAFDIVKEALQLGKTVSSSTITMVEPLFKSVKEMADRLVASSLASEQPLERTVELLNVVEGMAKAHGRKLKEICTLESHIQLMVSKVGRSMTRVLECSVVDQKEFNDLIPNVKNLRSKVKQLGKNTNAGDFTELLWVPLHRLYDEIKDDESKLLLFIEWVCAYCEQCDLEMPPWMMTKDQQAAKHTMQQALESGGFKQLREAAVLAKQANYKSDEGFALLYDECMKQLKTLKRLPSGWDVDYMLVPEGGEEKMFTKMDFGSEAERRLFQKIFDDTNLGILTRDRLARDKSGAAGALPRSFKVTGVQMVMNAESWDSYQKRLDQIVDDCKRHPGSAPITQEQWSQWSGDVLPQRTADQILETAKLPPCNAEANEFILLHGTKAEAADSIAENHFDMAFACKTGMFGAGLYFGESSSKCDEYAQPREDGRYAMILCRVMLGRVNYCDAKDPTTSPGRKALEQSCTPAGGYHSVLGDRKKARGTYREFILYDHYQVYPLFIVWYNRSF